MSATREARRCSHHRGGRDGEEHEPVRAHERGGEHDAPGRRASTAERRPGLAGRDDHERDRRRARRRRRRRRGSCATPRPARGPTNGAAARAACSPATSRVATSTATVDTAAPAEHQERAGSRYPTARSAPQPTAPARTPAGAPGGGSPGPAAWPRSRVGTQPGPEASTSPVCWPYAARIGGQCVRSGPDHARISETATVAPDAAASDRAPRATGRPRAGSDPHQGGDDQRQSTARATADRQARTTTGRSMAPRAPPSGVSCAWT